MIVALDLVCRAVLFAVLALAGIAKLRDRGGTRAAVAAFGAPASLVGPIAVALPVAELAIAGLLVSPATALAGALAAAVLLTVFSVAIGVSLARGRRPACRCFGQLSAEPVGGRTLLRNGILLLVAGALVAAEASRPSPDPVGRLVDGGPAVAVAAAIAVAVAAIAASAAVSLAVLRAYGRVLRRVDELERRLQQLGYDGEYEAEPPEIGLRPGTPAPLVDTVDIDAQRVLPAAQKRLLVVFTSPHCGPCGALLPDVAAWQQSYAERLKIAVAIDASAGEARAEARRYGLGHVIDDEGSALADAFDAHATPAAVLVDERGAVASWVAAGADATRSLVQTAMLPAPVVVGEPVPDVEVETLGGGPFSLAELRGRPGAIVFWNPGCGFCRDMHEELRSHEAGLNGDGRALVIASSGSREATIAEGFSSTVVLDQDQRLAGAFGAHGTPMAVLVAPDGTVASNIAAGAPAVVDLLSDPLPDQPTQPAPT